MALIIFFSATSCRYDMYKGCDSMPQQTVGTGEIIQNARLKGQFGLSSSPKEQVVTSDSLNIFSLEVSFDNGETYQSIDFSEYTVLGLSVSGRCWVVFDRNVTKNVERQTYIYTITVIECGDCYSSNSSMNWVLIPKIEEGFSVEFMVTHKQWNG